MASHKSAEKAQRRSLKRRARNRAHRARLRGQVKKLREAIQAGDAEAAKGLLDPTLSMIDHSAKLGFVHDNAAARTKSRLARAVGKLTAGSA